MTFKCMLFHRRCLQTSGALDVTLCLLKDSDGTVLLPIVPSHLSLLDLPSLRSSLASDGTCEIVWTQVIKAEYVIRCS